MKVQHLFICSLIIAGLASGCDDDSSANSNSNSNDSVTSENTVELCSDKQDNDNNGKTDCEEDSCKVFAICTSSPKTCEGAMPENMTDCECVEGEWANCVAAIKPCEEGASSCEGDTLNYCEGGVLKMTECPFKCVEGHCKSCNEIHGADTCEEKDGSFVHSYCSEEGFKTEECPYGCEGDHCLACIEGSQRCSEDKHSLETCVLIDGKAQWKAEQCPASCEDNRCTGCSTANTKTCKDGTLEICDSDKQYSSQTCEFGCKDDSNCRKCSEGMLRCDADGKTILVCKNDVMTFHSQCENACNNASCEDENGNHMKDDYDGDWKTAASCKKHSECSTSTGFCDRLVKNGTCMNKCQHSTQCIDGFVCRPDGRCAPEAFVTVWQTIQANEKISFKLNAESGCHVDVDWGDGVTETITGSYCNSRESNHTYAVPGEHRVKLTGNVDGWLIGSGSGPKLLRVESFGPVSFKTYAFQNASNLKTISKVDIPDSSKLTTMANMFDGATQFNDEMIAKWDVSKVTIMKSAFANTGKFNQNLNDWDTSKVTDMSYMFSHATGFNGTISDWDTSKVTDMNHMFEGAILFNSIVNSWNVSKVTNMASMFEGAKAFNKALNKWNVAKVNDMNSMFKDAVQFDKPLAAWNVSNVQNMSHMFSGAMVFNQPLAEWDVSKVTDMSHMFSNARNFNNDVFDWNVQNVKDMSYMFYYATSFSYVVRYWNVHNVTNMHAMFQGARMFKGDLTWDVSNVTDMGSMFENTNYNNKLDHFDVSSVTDMSRMFYNNASFNQPLKEWRSKTSNVKDMREMFYGATAFNQDVSTWNVANVQNMSRMFYNATSYNTTSNDWRPTYITNSKDCSRLSEIFYKTKLSCSEARSMLKNWSLNGVCTANQLRGSTDCD